MNGAGLILAGGLSTRMGRPKALLEFRQGTFLSAIWENLAPLQLGFVAVVCAEPLYSQLMASPELWRGGNGLLPVKPPFHIFLNKAPEAGPISSLQVGLSGGAEKWPWVIVAPCDHPAVKAKTYLALAQAAESGVGKLWSPASSGRRGHPVVYAQDVYDDLLQVPCGEGARWAVGRHYHERVIVPVADDNICRNVDTPDDYRRLIMEISND